MTSLTISNGVVIFDEKKYPKLSALLDSNALFIENDEIVGTALDGQVVSMCKIRLTGEWGCRGCCGRGRCGCDKHVFDTVENYLASNPTPDTW